MKKLSPVPPLVLLGGTNSYFSAKALAYLKWKRINFVEVAADADLYAEFIHKVVGVQQVPVLVDRLRGENVIDTSLIIDYCEEHGYGDTTKRVVPSTGLHRVVCLFIETFGDEWMKLPAMHYRWTPEEQRPFLQADWGRLLYPRDAVKKREEKVSKSMGKFSSMRKSLGVEQATIPGVEAVCKELLGLLSVHFDRHDFLFGSQPNLADFAMVGPMYAHLYRDPIPGAMMKLEFPHVAQWVERVMSLAPYSGGSRWVAQNGSLVEVPSKHHIKTDSDFDDDKLPESLRAVVALMVREHVPILEGTLKATQDYMQREPSAASGVKAIPRGIGLHSFSVGGTVGKRVIFTFDLWKLQRAANAYRALTQADAEKVGAFFDSLGEQGPRVVPLLEGVPALWISGTMNVRTKPSKL